MKDKHVIFFLTVGNYLSKSVNLLHRVEFAPRKGEGGGGGEGRKREKKVWINFPVHFLFGQFFKGKKQFYFSLLN